MNPSVYDTHMEVPQGNSLCSYLKQAKKQFFYFTKVANGRIEQILPGGIGTSVGRRGEERA
jgi:hypothetical protein